jgi:hypothetical protein
MIGVMIVIIIDESLEVPDLYLFIAVLALNERVKLYHWEIPSKVCSMIFKEFLDDLVTLKFI